MANFDGSIGNDTEIKYFDNGTHFVCTWNKMYLQDQQDAGPFTFQAILRNTGLNERCFFLLKIFFCFLILFRKYLF